jgi:prepilin-type N-terminal cleavage/methylation domain-containing protein
MKLTRHRTRRSGFSLLEVLAALAIFLFAVIGISQLLNVASNQVLETRYTNRAAQLLQSQMNRVISGEVSLNSQGDTSFEEDSDWTWSMDASSDSSITNLWTVTIKVSRARSDGSSFEASLTQMILDPAAKGTLESSSSSPGTTGTTQGN